MRGYFFDKAGDKRMERQNEGNWQALIDLMWEAVARGDDSLPKRPLDVIDIGCHTGGMLTLLKKYLGSPPPPHFGGIRSLAGIEPMDEPRARAKDSLWEGKFCTSIEVVPDQSIDVALSHEALYLVEDLDGWMRELKRILRPDGGAYIALGSHGENTAWLRWRLQLEELYGHTSYVYQPIQILEVGERAGFDMEIHRLHPDRVNSRRYSPPEDGWGEFQSAEELLEFNRQKLVFVCYPKR